MARSLIATLAQRHGPRITLEQRRDFLKATLAASAGLLLSSTPAMALTRLGRDSKKRVVVVGAGFAGLACAYELKSIGYDVTVIDPRKTVGGRVLSFNAANKNEFVPGRNIEGGAELIGSNHPAWVSYKEKFGLEFIDVSGDEQEPDCSAPVVIDGKTLDFEEAGKLWGEMEEGLNKMNELAKDVPEDEPWKAKDAAKWDKMSTAEWIKSLDVSDLVKKAMMINQVSDNGQPAEKQSLLGQLAAVKGGGLEKYWTDTEVFRCKGGNQQLAFKLADGIGRDRIALELSARSITVKGNVVIVECSDGRTIECDDVIFTAPPPTWRKVDFSPGLPGAMVPQMGLNTKFLSHVKERFWYKGDPKRSQYALGNGLVTMTWDGTDGQEGDAPACLTAFSGGAEVERALAMSKEEREKAFAEVLEQMYPGFKQNLVANRYMDWPKDPWTGASYSFPAPGQVTTVGPLMAQAHMGGRLHLAGEHTCYKFVGYMEGGLSSGVSVANRLAKRDGVKKS